MKDVQISSFLNSIDVQEIIITDTKCDLSHFKSYFLNLE